MTDQLQTSKVNISKQCVLLIDQDPSRIYHISRELGQTFELITANTSKSGFLKAIQQLPALIVGENEVMLQKENNLCSALKRHSHTGHIPIILFATQRSLKSPLQALTAGADAYLAYPMNVQELQQQINNLLLLGQRIHQYSLSEKPPQHHFQKNLSSNLLERIISIIEAQQESKTLSIEQLTLRIGISRTQLHCKVKASTGMSTSGFIRSIRLRQAMDLLQQTDLTISDIAYGVGFSSPSHFTTCFHKFFGYAPSMARSNNFIKSKNADSLHKEVEEWLEEKITPEKVTPAST